MTLGKHNLPIQEFPPMQIKLAVTGYGHSDKSEVLESVMNELNIASPPKPDQIDGQKSAKLDLISELESGTTIHSSQSTHTQDHPDSHTKQ